MKAVMGGGEWSEAVVTISIRQCLLLLILGLPTFETLCWVSLSPSNDEEVDSKCAQRGRSHNNNNNDDIHDNDSEGRNEEEARQD